MSSMNIMLHNVKLGMKISEDIFSGTTLLVKKDTVVNDTVLDLLRHSTVVSIPVYTSENDEKDELPIKPSAMVPTEQVTHSEKLRQSEDFKKFEEDFQKKTESFSGELNDIASRSADINVDSLFDSANELIGNTTNTYQLMDILSNIQYFDDSTYAHSLNVAMLANIFGRWLHMDEETLKYLTVAGMLHDVGKLSMPPEIIKKPGKLTDEEYKIIKQHPYKGYQILSAQKVDKRIAEAALLHHEKCDGTGYPMGLKSEGINDIAKIITIVDIYEAMTANRVYRDGLCPFEVIRSYEEDGFLKYDPKYLVPFLQGIADTYLHNTVLLSDGRQGEIIMTNKAVCSRPAVMVGNEYVDLATQHSLSIVSIL